MTKKLQIRNSTAEFLVFTNRAGKNTIEVRIEDETIRNFRIVQIVLS